MKTIRLLLLSIAAAFGCDYMAMPTDFTTVASGTRANLAANFGETENKFNPCADSVAQVRARLSDYSTSLAITSLEHMRLRLDGDATTTARFIIEGSSGDSLFRVSESFSSRLFGHLAIDSNLTARKVTAADSVLTPTLNVSGLTASRLVATNAGKTAASVSDLTSWIAGTANQITSTSDGDGSLTLSLPSAVTFPGSVTSTGIATVGAAAGDGAYLTWTNGIVTLPNLTRPFIGASSSSGSAPFNEAGHLVLASRGSGGDRNIYFYTPISGTQTQTLTLSGGAATFSGAVGATGKLTGSDTIAAALGFRAGSAGATDAQLYRSGANMWTTPDSLTVAGRMAVTGAAAAASIALGGNEAFIYDEGNFTLTGTGFSGSTTGTAYFVMYGKAVLLHIPDIFGTSNAATFTFTGIPVGIRPTRDQSCPVNNILDNSTDNYSGDLTIATDGTITVYRRVSATASVTGTFTSSGTKGIGYASCPYSLL